MTTTASVVNPPEMPHPLKRRWAFGHYSLHVWIVLLCLLFVTTLWTGLFLQVRLERAHIIDSKRQENDNLVRVFEEHVVRTVRAAEVTLREMASEYQRRGLQFDLVSYARDRGVYLDPTNVLSVIDDHGDLVLANPPPPAKTLNLSKNSNYQHHARSNDSTLFISTPRIGLTSGKWTVYLSIRITKPNGAFGGIVVIGMDPTYFSKLYAELNLGQDATVSLMGRDGVVRVREQGSKVTAGANLLNTTLFTQRLPAADHGNYLGISPVDGVKRVYSYRALKDYPLLVLIGTSETFALASLEARTGRYAIAAAGITLVIVCLGWIALTQLNRSKRADDALRLLNEQLETRVHDRTRELEATNRELETFTYSVSHDLKGPLRGIVGYTRLLEADYADKLGDEALEFLANVRIAAAQMDQLIDDLLAYSRLEKRVIQTTPVDLHGLVDSLLIERSREIDSTSAQVEQVLPAEAVLNCDREGLSIALRNLLQNALKFYRPGTPPVIQIGARDQGGSWLVWVRDNGIGFDMKFHDRIFAIFQRLHRSEDYPGTGVGLAIVKKALERMGGRAWAESKPGTGATFNLEVPK